MAEKYVDFAEAMKASKEGKVVRFHTKDGYHNSVFSYDYQINENGMDFHSFKDLLEGKWTIEYENLQMDNCTMCGELIDYENTATEEVDYDDICENCAGKIHTLNRI